RRPAPTARTPGPPPPPPPPPPHWGAPPPTPAPPAPTPAPPPGSPRRNTAGQRHLDPGEDCRAYVSRYLRSSKSAMTRSVPPSARTYARNVERVTVSNSPRSIADTRGCLTPIA